MKKVSIIIPTWGNLSNIERAIDSAIGQDYSNLEIIVVDDNGYGNEIQKNNESLVKKYGNRIKYLVHKKNRGGSAARNTGIKASSGEYICFLDDDDMFNNPQKIKLQVEAFNKLSNEWGATYSSANIFYGAKFIKTLKAKKSGNLLLDYNLDRTGIETGSMLIRRDAIYSIGFFDESFVRHQDWECYTRLMDRYKVFPVEKAIYDRYYKVTGTKRTALQRYRNMFRFEKMIRNKIKSISDKNKIRIIKYKYGFIILSALREKKFILSWHICRRKKYKFLDYCYLIYRIIVYLTGSKYYSHVKKETIRQ